MTGEELEAKELTRMCDNKHSESSPEDIRARILFQAISMLAFMVTMTIATLVMFFMGNLQGSPLEMGLP